MVKSIEDLIKRSLDKKSKQLKLRGKDLERAIQSIIESKELGSQREESKRSEKGNKEEEKSDKIEVLEV